MNEKMVPGRLRRITTGLVLLLSNLFACAVLGLLWVRLFLPDKAMGWDGLADVLESVMVGGLLGLFVSAPGIALLAVRRQWLWIGFAVPVAALVLAGLIITAPTPQRSPEPVMGGKTEPMSLMLRINTSRYIS